MNKKELEQDVFNAFKEGVDKSLDVEVTVMYHGDVDLKSNKFKSMSGFYRLVYDRISHNQTNFIYPKDGTPYILNNIEFRRINQVSYVIDLYLEEIKH